MKKLIKKILKEDLDYWGVSDASPENDEYDMSPLNEDMDEMGDRRQIYLNKIIQVMKNDFPLYKNLNEYGFYDELYEHELIYVLSKILEKPVFGITNPGRSLNVYGENRYKIYFEDYDGFWKKYEYDENGNIIYYESSKGHWEKREYDDRGKEIYYEDSDHWVRYEYDNRGNKIYEENSYGEWFRWDFDEHDREIYYEDSDGNIEYNR